MNEALSILNVGDGDTKITFDKDKPEERERACRIVADMLKLGYAIMVKDADGKWTRAVGFDPETAEYLVSAEPTDEAAVQKPTKKVKRGRAAKRLPASTTRAVGVARSAGGMSDRADSVEMENMRSFDTHAQFREGIRRVAELKELWAGIPMPLEDLPLVVEPRYPNAEGLMAIGRKPLEEDDYDGELKDAKIRNRFYSVHKRADIVVFEKKDGTIDWGLHHLCHSFDNQIGMIGASFAWGIEQEAEAIQTLAGLVRHHQFKQYMLTGMFMEKSERSGVTYIFRRLRPTVAITQNDDKMRILATLCAHPIAYYAGTWAGAMCPTDDVIAHLMMKRGDEALYWRRCNQHPAWRPESGI